MRNFFQTTDKGKCDVTLTYFNENNIRITPSCNVKEINIK